MKQHTQDWREELRKDFNKAVPLTYEQSSVETVANWWIPKIEKLLSSQLLSLYEEVEALPPTYLDRYTHILQIIKNKME